MLHRIFFQAVLIAFNLIRRGKISKQRTQTESAGDYLIKTSPLKLKTANLTR